MQSLGSGFKRDVQTLAARFIGTWTVKVYVKFHHSELVWKKRPPGKHVRPLFTTFVKLSRQAICMKLVMPRPQKRTLTATGWMLYQPIDRSPFSGNSKRLYDKPLLFEETAQHRRDVFQTSPATRWIAAALLLVLSVHSQPASGQRNQLRDGSGPAATIAQRPNQRVGSGPQAGNAGAASSDPMIEINLTGNVKVPVLLDLMSKELGIRFLHGTDISNREVVVYTPARLPKSVLPTLLGSLLREAELAIVDSEVQGWKRVIDYKDILSTAQTGDAIDVRRRNGPAGAVTQVFQVKNTDVTTASTSLRPLMTQNGSNLIAIPNQNILIISGYAPDVRQIVELLELIDKPQGIGVIDFYDAKNRSPEALINQIESLRAERVSRKTGESLDTKLFNDQSGQRVIVAGREDLVNDTIELLRQLDTGSGFLTRVYRLEYVSASRIDNLVRGFVKTAKSKEAAEDIESTIDDEGNLLVIRASAEIHQQVEKLIKELDREVASTESPIRFYKLKNATAIEVLYSLLALQQATGTGSATQAGGAQGGLGFGAFGTLGGLNAGGVIPVGGFNAAALGNQNATISMPPPPTSNAPATNRNMNQNSALSPLIGGVQNGGFGFGNALGGLGGLGGGLGAGQVATLPGGARVSADVATNSLIVYAPTNVQSLYEDLIRSLDQRRPQVLIEADIVAVDTSDNFSLGVEVSAGDREGSKRLFKFTSFGLSEVDPATGALTVNPSLGFNGVLIDPEVADVIVQALSSHTRSRVLASPKILVNDNQTGVLSSVASVPFQSVNASDTVATTSLGGSQEAGTRVTVTPHINEDDHLQLEFTVEFSSFVGDSGVAGLPPPRQIDSVDSVVTIPDAKTVVVGGLKRTGETDTFTGLPLVERIPILRELTSRTTESGTTTSFFLFIRPRILRDSQFRDLQYLSDVETQDAQLQGDYPQSRPLLIPCPTPPPQSTMLPSSLMHR